MKHPITAEQDLIISNNGVAWLLSQCHDQESLLAWVLGFRYSASGPETRGLQKDAVVLENGMPVAFFLPRGADGRGWYIPIRPDDRALLQILIPPSGYWFSTSDPLRRLSDLAARRNINLTPVTVGATCVAFAEASADYHAADGELGQFKLTAGYRNFGSLVSPLKARKYWALTVPLRCAAALPRCLG
jgi:hypothetical protein